MFQIYDNTLVMIKKALLIQEMDFSHCLRTEFTAYLVKTLVSERKSVNVIGAKGTGKTRLLEDLEKCRLPDATIVRVDLKAYAANYPGLIREIHRQLALNGDVPQRLDRLFAGLETLPRVFLVCLDNYDALLDNTRNHEKYDKDFFDDLNFLKNKGNVTLLCTTEEPHNALPVFIGGESHGNSWLTMEKELMPELTRKQVLAEIEREADPFDWEWIKVNHEEKELLLEAILGQPFPYPRLTFLVGKLCRQGEEDMALSFKKKLRLWLEEYAKLHEIGMDKRMHQIRARAEGVAAAAGVKKLKIPIISDLFSIIKKLLKIK